MAICPTNFATLLQIWLFLLSFLPYEPFPVLSISTTMNEMIMQIDSLVFLFRDCFLSSQIKNLMLAIILVVVVEALVVIMVMMLTVFMVVRVVKVFIVFMLFMVVEVVMVVKVVGQD